MSVLKLPVWVVRRKLDHSAPPGEPNGEPAHVIAFDSVKFTSRFVRTNKAEEWQVHLVANDQDLMFLATDLHSAGALGVCVNPEPDGSGGAKFSLMDVLAQIEKRFGPVADNKSTDQRRQGPGGNRP